KAAASPVPNRPRVSASEKVPLAKPVAEVNIDHQAMAAPRINREPKRSASQPPGIYRSAQDQLNAEAVHPMAILSSPNSAMIQGVAAPTTARSMYMTNAMAKVMPRTP